MTATMTSMRRTSASPKARNEGRSTASASGGGPSANGPR